jgi:hypothetical protein
MNQMRNAFKIFVRRLEGKRPLRRAKHRGQAIRMDLTEIHGKVWTGFIWLRIGTSGRHV